VVDEIEVNLEGAIAVWNRRGGQAMRRHVEHDMPGVIEPRRLREPDLANDLRPEVQRGVSVLPRRKGQVGPDFVAGGSV